MDANSRTIRSVFRDFTRNYGKYEVRDNGQWAGTLEDNLQLYAKNLVIRAIKARQDNPGKHNYTGNLLASIVSAVYKDKRLLTAYSSTENGVRAPFLYMMTASHGPYWLKVDYEGRIGSRYTPSIEAPRDKGMGMVEDFVSEFRPATDGYQIVLAYTAPYAEWVEQQRQTTGYLQTFGYAKSVGMKMFQLKSAS